MLTENPGQLKSMVSSSTEIFLTKRILRYIEMNGQLHCWNLAFEPIERKRLKNLKSIMGCSNLCVVFDTPCVLKFLQEREKDSYTRPSYSGPTCTSQPPWPPRLSRPPWPSPPPHWRSDQPNHADYLITPTPWPPWPLWPSRPSRPPQPPWPP